MKQAKIETLLFDKFVCPSVKFKAITIKLKDFIKVTLQYTKQDQYLLIIGV